MSDRMKNILIGLFVLAAIIGTVSTILFLEPQIGDGKTFLHVRFANITGINIVSRVNLAGKPVGEVTEIKVSPDVREEKTDPLGRIYFYELTLRVDSSVKVYQTDELIIATKGLMGEKSVAIVPKGQRLNTPSVVINDQIIYGDSIDPLQQAFHKITSLASEMQTLVNDVDVWFVANKEEMTNAITSFSGAMTEAETTIASINEDQIVSSVKTGINTFNEDMTLVQDMLTEAKDAQMVKKLDRIIDNVEKSSLTLQTEGKEILQNINQISQDLADGSGTLGKVIKGDDLYMRVTAVMSKVDTLMNDINHYGLLFGYDKHWQRLRTKKSNLLEALQTPKEFRSYFENEIDEITTSLARISILLEKAQEKKELIKTPSFQKDFTLLLKRANDLGQTLKLYNEDLAQKIDE